MQEQGVIRSLTRIAPDTTDAPFFTGKEMTTAVKIFKDDKAPGMDLIEGKRNPRAIPKSIQWVVFSGTSFLQSGRRITSPSEG